MGKRLVDLNKMSKMDHMIKVIQTIPMDYRLDLFDRAIRIASLHPADMGMSWAEYKTKYKDSYKREESYRMKMRPRELTPLELGQSRQAGTTAESTMYTAGTIRSQLQIVDSTSKFRNNLIVKNGSFTPMDDIMKQVPNMIKENIQKVMNGMFEAEDSSGGYWDAPSGEGKTTMFQSFLPRMSAELALTFKPLWYKKKFVPLEGGGGYKNRLDLFLESEEETFTVLPQRFYNLNAKSFNSGSPFVGQGDKMPNSIMALIEDNPESIVLVLDEVYTAFTRDAAGGPCGGRVVSEQGSKFVDLTKATIGNDELRENYKYKMWGLYASQFKRNFECVGKESFLAEEMERRIAPQSAITISWLDQMNQSGERSDRDPVRWLDGAIDSMLSGMQKQHIYKPEIIEQSMADMSPEEVSQLESHMKQVRPIVIDSIIEKARRIFRRENRTQDQTEFKLAVPAALAKTVKGCVNGSYRDRLDRNDDWSNFNTYKNGLRRLQKQFHVLAKYTHDITEALRNLPPDSTPPTPPTPAPVVSASNKFKTISAREEEFRIPNEVLESLNQQERAEADQINNDLQVFEQNSDILRGSTAQRKQQLLEKIEKIQSGVRDLTLQQLRAHKVMQRLESSLRSKYERGGDTFAKDLTDFPRLAVCDVDTVKSIDIQNADAGDYANKDEGTTAPGTPGTEVQPVAPQQAEVQQTRPPRRRPITPAPDEGVIDV